MKSLILYGSEKKLTNAHKLVTGPKQTPFYVRADTFHGDCMTALEKAKPMREETVLNTVEEGMFEGEPMKDGAFVGRNFQ